MLWITDTQGNLVNLAECSQIVYKGTGTLVDNQGSVKVCTPEHTIQVFAGTHHQCKQFLSMLYAYLYGQGLAIPDKMAEVASQAEPDLHH